MSDVQLIELAARQHNRVSRTQLEARGYKPRAIQHRIESGRLAFAEHDGVYAVAPRLDDDRGRLMAATLTAPDTYVSHESAVFAHGIWTAHRAVDTVTRPGNGGPTLHGNLLVYRSETLAGDTAFLGPIPITTAERTLIDIAPRVSERALAHALREFVRLGVTDTETIAEALGRHRGRRGVGKVGRILERYAGIPIARARSGAEVLAMRILREAGHELPKLNVRIAGEEADLSWRRRRLIVEIDGGPFHLDVGEDARKQAVWERAGWSVRRIPAGAVYDEPWRLLALAPRPLERR
jgi:hypothetical protein